MRLILARLLWNYDLELAEDSIGWDERNEFYMMYDKGPLYIYLKTRGSEE